MNSSDLRAIGEDIGDMEYIGMNAACLRHTFESSGRTVYRFFSVDSYLASLAKAEKAVAGREREREEAREVLSGKKRKGLVKTVNPNSRSMVLCSIHTREHSRARVSSVGISIPKCS
jgi:hypothetical protein